MKVSHKFVVKLKNKLDLIRGDLHSDEHRMKILMPSFEIVA